MNWRISGNCYYRDFFFFIFPLFLSQISSFSKSYKDPSISKITKCFFKLNQGESLIKKFTEYRKANATLKFRSFTKCEVLLCLIEG